MEVLDDNLTEYATRIFHKTSNNDIFYEKVHEKAKKYEKIVTQIRYVPFQDGSWELRVLVYENKSKC